MTCEEFSDQFDVQVDAYKRFKDFDNQEMLDSLDFSEYEKSVFLTDAQAKLVTAYYSGRTLEGFEKTEEARKSLDRLVVDWKVPDDGVDHKPDFNGFKIQTVVLPEDCWYIIWESATYNNPSTCLKGEIETIPIEHDNLWKLLTNPFKGPSDKRVLRLNLSKNTVELISKHSLIDYHIRYVKEPSPIILVNLPNGLTIEGISEKTECELDNILHDQILDLAVKMAIQSKLGTQKSESKQS